MRVHILPLFLALSVAVPALAQDATRSDFIVGVQTADGTPLPGATVLVGGKGAATDVSGEATIQGLLPGRYPVRVSYIGYRTREVAARLDAPGPWGLIVELAEDLDVLGEVVVTARDLRGTRLEADGFFEREAVSSGTILTVEDLQRRTPRVLADVFGGVLGVRLARAGTGTVAVTQNGGSECRLAVFLDGRYNAAVSDDLTLMPAQDIVAVEVYRRPSQVPLQYNQLGTTDGCGVALVWTKLSIEAR